MDALDALDARRMLRVLSCVCLLAGLPLSAAAGPPAALQIGITISPSTLPAGTVGSAFSQQFTQTGGSDPVSWFQSGTLPAGLTFTGDTLSGTPAQEGSFPITVTVTDDRGREASQDYTLQIASASGITISPATLPAGSVGNAYSQQFTQTGAIGAVAWSLSGSLPLGLSFAGDTLAGTPLETGSFDISVTATDEDDQEGSRDYTLQMTGAALTISPATLPAGTVGSAYNQQLTQTGGSDPIDWAYTGSLPSGLSFSGDTLSGTPSEGGTFTVTVTATDVNARVGGRLYALQITYPAGITISPATVPTGWPGGAYSQQFTQVGGSEETRWSLTGNLPAGLSFAGDTLSGTPTQSGIFTFTLSASDDSGRQGSRNYTLVVTPLLRLRTVVERDIVPAGWVVRYTIRVKNLSPDLLPLVTVTDTLSGGAFFVAADPAGYVRSGRNIVWTLTDLPAGATRRLHVSVWTHTTMRGVIDNVAQAVAGAFSTTVHKLVSIVAP